MLRRIIITSAFGIALCLTASAQERIIRQNSPEQEAMAQRISVIWRSASEMIREKKFEVAVEVLKEGIDLELKLMGKPSGCKYLLAKALEGQGKNDKALAAYKQIMEYDPLMKEIGSDWVWSSDYAILLAKCGKMQEAKIVYYSLMRMFNPEGMRGMEPMPMIIVFDPDPVGTYWEYTPERLCAAVLMMRTAMAPSHEEDFVAQAMKLAPDWAYPPLYRARSGVKETFLKYLHIAENLAQSDQEREWIRMYSVVRNLPNSDDLVEREEREHQRIGQKLRKECPAIQNSRLELPKTFSKVATQYRKSESTPSPGG